ncbi:MAG: hypothetical protein JKY44_00545 [Flavobacteriaceae bacterium]|nr:hypothetical protein [Flavobacteriaceae bacterium]
MRKTLLLFIFTSLFISCNKENEKFYFIGNWSTTSDTNFNIDIQFFKDSMVIDDSLIYGTYSNKWKVKGSKIEQTLLRGDKSILNYKNTNYYKFNLTKDTLFIKNDLDSIHYFKFAKINNGFEYFENKIGLRIKLEKVSDGLITAGNDDYNFNIYISTKNNKIIAKTDYSNNLNNLASQLFNFKSQIPVKDEKKLKYVLFIDKNVSNKKIDSIKSLFIKEIVEKIFIVKNYKENRWNEPINWLGIYEN